MLLYLDVPPETIGSDFDLSPRPRPFYTCPTLKNDSNQKTPRCCEFIENNNMSFAVTYVQNNQKKKKITLIDIVEFKAISTVYTSFFFFFFLIFGFSI